MRLIIKRKPEARREAKALPLSSPNPPQSGPMCRRIQRTIRRNWKEREEL